MLFIIEFTNLNASTSNEDIGFHVIPNFDPPGEYLRRLSSKIRGAKCHDILIQY